MKRTKQARLVLTAAVAWALPSVAYACPVCFAAQNEAARVAFLATTVFLTASPVLMVGGVIYWLVSRSEAASEVEPATTEAVEETRLGA